MDINELLNDMAKERYERQKHEFNSLEYKVRTEYAYYFAWCMANNCHCDDTNFKKYCIEEKKDIQFYIKKKLFEMYFNYVFEYDNANQKWKSKKIIAT